MTRYEQRFADLVDRNEGALAGFLVLGDPDHDQCLELMKVLADSGCDMLELGIPWSDPLADGPTIQAAMARALKSGTTPATALKLVSQFRQIDSEIPIGLLVYANLVVRRGIDEFYRRCRDSGVDSVLVADVPLHECQPFLAAAAENGIDPVLLCPPTATAERIAAIARVTRGYTYLLSRAGVTGIGVKAGRPVKETLALLQQFGAPPPMIGFGISQPQHVAGALRDGARGVICGSAIIERIAQGLHEPSQMLESVGEFVSQLKRATVQS